MNEFTYLKDINFDNIRYYIGASDVATLAGLNIKYKQTPLTLWEEKTGRRESNFNNERMDHGHDLEPLILKWGLEKLKTDDPIKYDQHFYKKFMVSRINNDYYCQGHYSLTECKCPEYPFIKAHTDLFFDGVCYDTSFIMEAKSAGFYGSKRNDNINLGYDKEDMSANGIPTSVYLQVQTQMLCYDIPVCYVSVMIDTGIHKLYGPIPAHKKTQEKIIALCVNFWRHVTTDQPPTPMIWKDVLHLNPGFDKDSKIVIGGAEEEKAMYMKEVAKKLREEKKEIDEKLSDIKNAMGLLVGENKWLESSAGDKIATAFNATKYTLKDRKKMSKRRFNRLKKDGFISESTYRDIRF